MAPAAQSGAHHGDFYVGSGDAAYTPELGKSSPSALPAEAYTEESNAFEGPSRSVPATLEPDEGLDDWVNNPSKMRYTILETPPWWECLLLGAQQYLTMLGSTVLIPFLIVPKMGGTDDDLARVIGTIFFVSGLITLLQTIVGDRLPIIQGGSFAFLTPVISIAANIKAANPEWAAQDPMEPNHERFLLTMRVVSGGIAGSAFIIFAIGASGLINWLLQYISPITVAANIGIVGLSLYQAGFPTVGTCPQLGLPMIGFVVLFSQYLRHVSIPIPYVGRLRFFELFPILLAIIINWVIGIIVTESGHYDNSSPATQAACRTDHGSALTHSPWIRFPYPGQWGGPIFTGYAVVACLAGSLSAMVESLGDYYAAARISGAPVPPPAVLSRAVAIQGFSCIMTGFWGTGNGTTAYNENIGAMQITRVGSRRVIQVGAVFAIIIGLICKISGLFASVPQAMIAGLFCVVFALITAVGLSQFQFADQNSPRNLFVLGFALYMGLSIPYFFQYYNPEDPTEQPVRTGDASFNAICNILFSTAAADALIITMFLDNTIPGTIRERGLHVWMSGHQADQEWWADDDLNAVYGWPFDLSRKFGMWARPYTARRNALVASITQGVHSIFHPLANCLTCGQRPDHAASQLKTKSSAVLPDHI